MTDLQSNQGTQRYFSDLNLQIAWMLLLPGILLMGAAPMFGSARDAGATAVILPCLLSALLAGLGMKLALSGPQPTSRTGLAAAMLHASLFMMNFAEMFLLLTLASRR